MKVSTKAKNLRSILAEKLETGWTITPIEIEQAGGYSVKCWHQFSCRKEVKTCGKIVYSHTGYTPGSEQELIEQIKKLQ